MTPKRNTERTRRKTEMIKRRVDSYKKGIRKRKKKHENKMQTDGAVNLNSQLQNSATRMCILVLISALGNIFCDLF
jgi:hypothetical protein